MTIITGSSQKIHQGRATFQYLAAFACTLNIITSGMHYGWPSPSIVKLQHESSHIVISNDEGSWTAVMPLLGALLGSLIVGTTVDILGRKRTIILSSFPFFASWIMIAYARSVVVIYVARFLAGVADGWMFTAGPMYIGEIADPKIRGMLGSGVSVTWIFGILLINSLGCYLSVSVTALVSSVLPVAALLAFMAMPESPYYHIMRNNTEAAKKSLQILRGTQDVESELTRVSLAVKVQTENTGKFLDLFSTKSNRKAVIIMSILRGIQQLSGVSALTFYTQQIFSKVGGDLPSEIATIIYYSVQFTMSCLSSSIVDKTGRRPLLLTSLVGSCLALAFGATYFLLQLKTEVDVSQFSLVPAIALILFIVSFSLGMQTVPILMLGELFPANVKAFALCLADIYFCIIATGVSKFFQITNDSFGMYVPMYVFAGNCLMGSFLIYSFVPETKGKTLEDIQRHLRGEDTKLDEETMSQIPKVVDKADLVIT